MQTVYNRTGLVTDENFKADPDRCPIIRVRRYYYQKNVKRYRWSPRYLVESITTWETGVLVMARPIYNDGRIDYQGRPRPFTSYDLKDAKSE